MSQAMMNITVYHLCRPSLRKVQKARELLKEESNWDDFVQLERAKDENKFSDTHECY